ncbi:ABC transporter ATP-binding protein [Acidovorax sp. Leaf76]|jgi:branched-chain amino acid transport system ATP-binding protein|uniref:ABC transporter ATP-binding protein n=1 Tax=unclassified Acidovorax TaxID=2684926 RepID=UPI0006F226B5|nr:MULTISPECIES: ABC transporter ATP-binding protein [unclassified Acidovorax]KQO16178.1 ABC transporter ATP-binding protein [Acidovorax sp. Leaf76]KQO32250.1 ABC transporter ATP-binding protein [Acidovorax sp. Leaf84]KQS31811.1 ABC transporter ATP-binding protein [Acidovorax sp. Leaf191]
MPLLEIDAADVFYGDFQALSGITLSLEEGQVLALIGANGAGKTTLLRAITGLHAARGGSIRFDNADVTHHSAEALARIGIAMVPEGRMLFPSLSVHENLQMGTLTRRPGRWTLDAVYDTFPVLKDLRQRNATQLSGGQQQMVAIGRALLCNPRLLLCDELSLGLAPLVVEDIYRTFARIRGEGLSIVLVEQDVARACAVSDQMACLLKGQVTLQGASAAVSNAQVTAAYFGE